MCFISKLSVIFLEYHIKISLAHRSFVLNGEIYFVGDFACVQYKGSSKTRICRLMTLYHSNESWHSNAREKAIVRWYTWAKDLENRHNPQRIKFDLDNEVIEDYRGVDVVISLNNIIRKCRVVFATEEDPIDLIRREKLDRNLYFSCRYKITSDEIEPIFSLNSEWGEKEVFMTLSVQNSPITSTADLKSPLKRKTPVGSDDENVAKNLRLTAKMDLLNISSPKQRKSVKRNLNDSFADIPDSENNTPILNYSIVSPPTKSKDAVRIKLRVSQNQNPQVVLKKLDDAVVKSYINEENKTLRRSSRSVARKSYAELISPEKFTPKKRNRTPSVSSEIADVQATLHRRTPTKSGKNITQTPIKHTDTPNTRKSILKAITDCSTPTKRVTLIENHVAETPKRNTRVSTPRSVLKSTPASRLKQIKEGIITPSIQKREIVAQKSDTPLIKARSQLHVSHVPDALPCREKEYSDIRNFLEGKLQDGCGG